MTLDICLCLDTITLTIIILKLCYRVDELPAAHKYSNVHETKCNSSNLFLLVKCVDFFQKALYFVNFLTCIKLKKKMNSHLRYICKCSFSYKLMYFVLLWKGMDTFLASSFMQLHFYPKKIFQIQELEKSNRRLWNTWPTLKFGFYLEFVSETLLRLQMLNTIFRQGQ